MSCVCLNGVGLELLRTNVSFTFNLNCATRMLINQHSVYFSLQYLRDSFFLNTFVVNWLSDNANRQEGAGFQPKFGEESIFDSSRSEDPGACSLHQRNRIVQTHAKFQVQTERGFPWLVAKPHSNKTMNLQRWAQLRSCDFDRVRLQF